MVGEEIASEPKSFASHVEEVANEVDKEAGHRRIRVGEDDLVAASRSLCPIQHAAHDVKTAQAPCPPTALELPGNSSRASLGTHGSTRKTLALMQTIPRLKLGVLFVGQFDVSDPQAHRGFRHAKQPGNLLNRPSLFAAHPSRPFSLACFHF